MIRPPISMNAKSHILTLILSGAVALGVDFEQDGLFGINF